MHRLGRRLFSEVNRSEMGLKVAQNYIDKKFKSSNQSQLLPDSPLKIFSEKRSK